MNAHRHYRQQPSAWNQRLGGGRFVSSDNGAVLTPNENRALIIGVSDWEHRWFTVSEPEELSLSLLISGPGGIHPDHAPKVNSTVYVIYAAWCSSRPQYDGSLCLFAVPSGTAINAAKVASLGADLPRDMWSEPIGFVVTDAAGATEKFTSELGWFEFDDRWPGTDDYGLLVLNGGSATAATNIDTRPFLPVECKRALFTVLAFSSVAGNTRSASIGTEGDSGTKHKHLYLNLAQGLVGYPKTLCKQMTVYNSGRDLASDFLWYQWNSSGTISCSIYLSAVELWSCPP